DVLGRAVKTEVLNWDGAGAYGTGGSVYSAAVNTYNAPDQVTQARQWPGPENGGGAYQDTTMPLYGYGRLHTKHGTEQRDANGNPAYTTYSYNNDDTINMVTDARGASATYTYNNGRHLVNQIHYTAPTGITPTADVTFDYDPAGNRKLMTDGLGSVSY